MTLFFRVGVIFLVANVLTLLSGVAPIAAKNDSLRNASKTEVASPLKN